MAPCEFLMRIANLLDVLTAPALARGASCEVGLESTTLSLFFARGSAGAWSVLFLTVDGRLANAAAWSVLRIPFESDEPLVLLGGW